jgi:hypothetical protein
MEEAWVMVPVTKKLKRRRRRKGRRRKRRICHPIPHNNISVLLNATGSPICNIIDMERKTQSVPATSLEVVLVPICSPVHVVSVFDTSTRSKDLGSNEISKKFRDLRMRDVHCVLWLDRQQ